MDVSIIRMPEGLSKWYLVTQYLRLRKDIFIDRMSWPLHHVDAMEFEQYDNAHAVYVIAHEGACVLGGARLVRTDKTFGSGTVIYSYMIRDAWRKLLPGLPSELCDAEPPADPKVWELTRFASDNSARVGAAILTATNDFLKAEGATTCLFLGPPAFMRMAKRMSFSPKPLGNITGNADGQFLAFACDVI